MFITSPLSLMQQCLNLVSCAVRQLSGRDTTRLPASEDSTRAPPPATTLLAVALVVLRGQQRVLSYCSDALPPNFADSLAQRIVNEWYSTRIMFVLLVVSCTPEFLTYSIRAHFYVNLQYFSRLFLLLK